MARRTHADIEARHPASPPYCTARSRRLRRWSFGLGIGLVLSTCGALLVGAVSIVPSELPSVVIALFRGESSSSAEASVMWAIRGPRIILGMLTGATLAVGGAALQGVFRNPLADPGLIGVSSGAALAASATTVLGATLFPTLLGGAALLLVLPVGAFGGALSITVIVLALSRRQGHREMTTMLLIGIAVNAVASAGTATLMVVASDAQLRSLTFWLLGSLGGATWELIGVTALPMLLMLLAVPRYAGPLDLMLLGEAEATHLGVNVEQVRRRVVGWVALGVGAAVAATGLIGFVGLVVPHMLRLALGPSHRHLLPLSAVLGAITLVLADTLARTVVAPIELPIGAVTALLGAPVFLHLVSRRAEQRVLA